MTERSFDPIQFEVIRSALVAATEEMALTLRRSAYSTNIKTRADFSCAFFDRETRPAAQASSQPVHLGSLTRLVPAVVSAYGLERLRPGDAILVNDPYLGGVHLNDVTLISPVYCHGELLGFVANLAHHVDVGGGAPGSIGAFREIYQEGIIIPPVRLVDQGAIVDDVFSLVLAQLRSKRETAGDLRAQIATNNTGVNRLQALVESAGLETVRGMIDALLDYTERRARGDMRRLPIGSYTAETHLDSDGFGGEPVRLVGRVDIDDDDVLFDLTGCDVQRRAPVNATFAQTYSACAYVLRCLIDPDVPVNAGFYRLVRVIAPEGTVVNCSAPAPVVGGWETQVRLTDLLFKALAPAVPKLVPAASKGMMCQVAFGGTDPRSGDLYAFYETIAGGYGGRHSSDGPDAVQAHGQNTENAPVEETEGSYPVRILRYELIPDSEGPGRQRGGLGLRRDYAFPDHNPTFTILADQDKTGPWGLFGGQAAPPARYVVNPEGEARSLGSKTTVELRPGDVVSIQSCGGGGYGPASERDPEQVLADVQAGKVSVRRSRDEYRVIINAETRQVDSPATQKLRAQRETEGATRSTAPPTSPAGQGGGR